MSGLYKAKVRADITTEDPTWKNNILNTKFFHPYLTYNARIDKDFTGTFSLTFSQDKLYIHHSRYLKDIILLGANNTDVRVNELDNEITGNAGNNTVYFNSIKANYTISSSGSQTVVRQTTSANNVNDGKNTLLNIERLHFQSVGCAIADC